MKKKEIAKKLLPLLKTWEDSRVELKMAEQIIDKLVELGMLPPTRTYEDWTGMGTITETDNTWEPE
jgi:hypothetical protein